MKIEGELKFGDNAIIFKKNPNAAGYMWIAEIKNPIGIGVGDM